MRKMNFVVAALLTMTFSYADEVEVSVANESAEMKKIEQSCSKLSNDEQNFANNLNEQNKKAFCEKLSMEQRKDAMKMSSNTSCAGAQRCSEKKTLTPNEAVQKILTDHSIAMDEVVENSAEPTTQTR